MTGASRGLVVNQLYEDLDLMDVSAKTLIIPELGKKYKITDVEGTKPSSNREALGGPREF